MKDFVNEISKIVNAKEDLIEKDVLLHQILLDLSKTNFVKEFVFKGGTCLIKCYLGYYRFSGDLDFTFIDQNVFDNVSQKKIRGILSKKINEVGEIFEGISKQRKLEFKCNKKDKKYVELGGGNKFVTFKLWYTSVTGENSFVKIQINFVEEILFKIKELKLKGLKIESKELSFLFPKLYSEYTSSVKFKVYDIREILCEKIRAILTRRGIKERDFIDVYLISEEYKIKPEKLEREIAKKINFMLKLYKKYRTNIKEKSELLRVENYPFGSEKYLLLKKIDKKQFYSFLNEFLEYLRILITSLKSDDS